MFSKFPRECGPPRKIMNNINEFLSYINNHNGKKKAVYTSVYTCDIINNKANYDNIKIDKLFFDFDDKSCDAYKECNLLHKSLLKDNIKHIIAMSGRGYHLYILTNSYKPQNVKSIIYNSQMYFITQLKLSCDRQIVGNNAQLARVFNTYNAKAKLFCIPLTQEQFESGDVIVKHLALKQNFIKNYVIGKELFDISKFDYKTKEFDNFKIDIEEKSSDNIDYESGIPICIQQMLDKKNCGWKERYLIILFFKERGYTIKEINQILKQHLSERKYKHCIQDERQLQYLFERDDLIFPSCEKIIEDNLCPKKCELLNNLIYKNL